MIFERTMSKCSECPLRDRTRVWGQGSFVSKIAVVGEAPGKDEDRLGRPFVGPAGQVLRAGLAGSSINPDTVHYTNLIACRPPDNDLDSFEAQEALECCRPGFDAELRWLEQNGVKVVIAAGNHAAWRFGAHGTITKIRGSVYEYKP